MVHQGSQVGLIQESQTGQVSAAQQYRNTSRCWSYILTEVLSELVQHAKPVTGVGTAAYTAAHSVEIDRASDQLGEVVSFIGRGKAVLLVLEADTSKIFSPAVLL